jgi:Leucine-rich repeat (LRR) protein
MDLSEAKEIYLANCYITRLPENIPDTLIELKCYINLITELPDLCAFKHLKVLYCSENQLTEIVSLPDSLEELLCSFNKLKTLPSLPPKLKTLICDHNELKTLPPLPQTLYRLNCSNNKLTTYPYLPFDLYEFDFSYQEGSYINSLHRQGSFKDRDIKDIKRFQHNERRESIGLKEEYKFPSEKEWKRVWDLYTASLYKVDGEKYQQAEKEFEKIFTSETSA